MTELNLSGNGFGHIEAESLGQALKHNRTLKLLNLSSNRICDEDVPLLCHGLATNDTLRVLQVRRQQGVDPNALVFYVIVMVIGQGLLTCAKCEGFFPVYIFCPALPQPYDRSWSSDVAPNG